MSIAAFYQCYKNNRSFEHSLENFRKHYPTEELFIINDGGNKELEDIAKKYKPTYYKYESNIHGLTWDRFEDAINFLPRLYDCMMYTKADYILLLEDDVFIMNRTNINKLYYDINGCNFNMYFNENISKYISIRNKNVTNPIFYGGCGGCFLNVNSFKSILKDMETVKYELNLFNILKGPLALDIILSYLILINNGTIGMYPGFCETHHSNYLERLKLNNIEVLHQYKDLYCKDIRYIDENNCIIDHKNIEHTEQLQAEKYITSDSVVLELGARYGTVSCIINKKISIPTNQVSVEPDVRVHKALEYNMRYNNCNFHILKGFISKIPMNLSEHNSYGGYGVTSIKTNTSLIPSFTLEEIENKYNLKFNTIVADCEGFLEQFFDENPHLYSQISLIIFEQDYANKCNYKKIIDNLILNHFKCLEDGPNMVWKK